MNKHFSDLPSADSFSSAFSSEVGKNVMSMYIYIYIYIYIYEDSSLLRCYAVTSQNLQHHRRKNHKRHRHLYDLQSLKDIRFSV